MSERQEFPCHSQPSLSRWGISLASVRFGKPESFRIYGIGKRLEDLRIRQVAVFRELFLTTENDFFANFSMEVREKVEWRCGPPFLAQKQHGCHGA